MYIVPIVLNDVAEYPNFEKNKLKKIVGFVPSISSTRNPNNCTLIYTLNTLFFIILELMYNR